MPNVNANSEKKERRKEVESPVADEARCAAAVQGLSDAELRKLKEYAASRVSALPGVGYYADGEDLKHEAIARTLDGRRKWKPQRVDFITHLMGCVRSIANQYVKEGRRRSEKLPDEVSLDDEERLYRTLMVNTAGLLLKPDAIAFAVFNLLLDGHTPGAVRSILNVEETTYAAARKRIARRLRANLAA